MPTEPRFYPSSEINSITTLQNTCNTDELDFLAGSRLKSLDAVSNDGEKATEAMYEQDDDHTGLGTLIIKKYTNQANADEQIEDSDDEFLFKGRAYILTVLTKVLVFRKTTE